MLNPVLKKEIKTSTRSWKAPMLVTVYVGVLLSIMAFTFWAQGLNEYNPGVEPRFVRDLFVGLAYLQLGLVLFVAPSMTTSAISGELQRSTFDVLLATRLSTRSIIIGKLSGGLYKVFMLIVASIPVFAIIYMFGGIGLIDLLLYVFVCMMSALLMGSIGILMSTFFKKTTAATAFTYAILLFLTIGVMMLTGAAYIMMDYYSGTTDMANALMYLHPFAPLSALLDLKLGLGIDFLRFGSGGTTTMIDLIITLGIQLGISGLCVLLAAKRINPIKKVSRKVVG